MRFAFRVCGLVAASGCLSGSYRYVDVPGSVVATRAQLEQRAKDQGLVVSHERGATLLEAAPPRDEAPRPDAPIVVAARFHALAPDRTRIELGHDLERGKALVPDPAGTIVTPTSELAWSEWLGIGFEGVASAGVGTDPAHPLAGRLDFGVRIAKRLHRFGDVDSAIASRWALLATAGVGVRFGPEGAAFRPELLISVGHQRAGWYVPTWQLPTGPRTLFDLGFAGLLEEGGRRGVELGVSLRRPPWSGFYVRGGVLRGSATAHGGPIFSVGAEAGVIPTLVVLAIGAVVAGVAGAAEAKLSDGITGVLGGG